MNTSIIEENNHLIDTHWAIYTQNYLSEFFPEYLLKITFNGTVEEIICDISRIGADEQSLYNTSGSNDSGIDATNDLQAKEYSYNAIREYINSLEK